MTTTVSTRSEAARNARAGGTAHPLKESRFESPIGTLVLFWSPTGVRALVFASGRSDCVARLRRQGAHPAPRPMALPETIAAPLERYFGGLPGALDAVRLDLIGTPFQRSAWDAMRRIPPGRSLSYGALAASLGTPRGARAVGRAAATNPVSLIVPCHRVVGGDGTPTGFLWGVERKRWLLAHEAAHSENDRHARTTGAHSLRA